MQLLFVATVDVKKTIFDIAPNRDDEVLAIIEVGKVLAIT